MFWLVAISIGRFVSVLRHAVFHEIRRNGQGDINTSVPLAFSSCYGYLLCELSTSRTLEGNNCATFHNSRMVERMLDQKLKFYHLLGSSCHVFCRNNLQTTIRHARFGL